MITYKVKYKKYLADLYVPETVSGAVIVLLPGLPRSSNIEKLVRTLTANGNIVLYPSFSGSFDSGGTFSGSQCIDDVQSFIGWAKKGEFKELYFGKNLSLRRSRKVVLMGMSFGAFIALLGNHTDVNKLVLLSPALLFRQKEINEIVDFDFRSQMKFLHSLLKNAFPFSYRVASYENLANFLNGSNNYQSVVNVEKTLKEIKLPTLILHGKKDSSIPWKLSERIMNSVKNPRLKWVFPNVAHGCSSYDGRALKTITDFISE